MKIVREKRRLLCIRNLLNDTKQIICKEGNVYTAYRRKVIDINSGELIPVLRIKGDNGERFVIEDKKDSSGFGDYFKTMRTIFQ